MYTLKYYIKYRKVAQIQATSSSFSTSSIFSNFYFYLLHNFKKYSYLLTEIEKYTEQNNGVSFILIVVEIYPLWHLFLRSSKSTWISHETCLKRCW